MKYQKTLQRKVGPCDFETYATEVCKKVRRTVHPMPHVWAHDTWQVLIAEIADMSEGMRLAAPGPVLAYYRLVGIAIEYVRWKSMPPLQVAELNTILRCNLIGLKGTLVAIASMCDAQQFPFENPESEMMERVIYDLELCSNSLARSMGAP